jgi:alpha-glucosidase
MDAVLRFWLDRGVDGFRMDAVHRLGHDPELRDNVPGEPRRDDDLEVAHDVLRRFRRVLDAYEGAMAVGEAYVLDEERLARFYGTGDELHLVFDFSFLRQPWSARSFRDAIERFESVLPPGAWPDWTLSNHDHPRVATRYGADGRGAERARLAAMMLLTLRGTPFLYYGDEIGMPDVPVEPVRRRDPMERDLYRAPMPWELGPNGGFTTGVPWLPMPDPSELNVEGQRANPASMLSLVRSLIWYRRRSDALRWGALRLLVTDEDVLAYERRTDHERILVALNFADRDVNVPVEDAAGQGVLERSTDPGRREGSVSLRPLRLGALEGAVLRCPPR